MRIVYLNPCGQMGGAETSLVELLAALRAAEPAWDLRLILGEDGPLAEKVRALGVPVTVVPFPPALARLGDAGMSKLGALPRFSKAAWQLRPYTRRLAEEIRGNQPQIIHATGFKMQVLGLWARPDGVPVIWHLHDYVRSRPLMRRLLRWHSQRCATAIVNSESVAADVRAGCHPGLKVTRLYNAIDLRRFSPAGPKLDLDALAGLPPADSGTVRVGLIATFARWKGHQAFLEALARLPAGLEVRGYVIGGPIYQTAGSQYSFAELRGRADRLGLAGRVGFTGFVDDTAQAMRALDIVVHASTQPEPFGMVIIEGMACGRAVIASHSGGAAEIFEEGRNALGHSPGDVQALAQQIARAASDRELRTRLGKAGRASVEERFHHQRLAQELLAIYQSIADQRKDCELAPAAAMSLR